MKETHCPWRIVLPEEKVEQKKVKVPYVIAYPPEVPIYYNNYIGNIREITYPGIEKYRYSVSANGIVVDVSKGWVISQFIDGNGYYRCNLMRDDGIRYQYNTHRLVAWEWVQENRDYFLTVNHKDGNKLNNNYGNLEWITSVENVRHAIRTGLTPEHLNQGESHGMSKLTNEDVHLICRMLENPNTTYDEVLEAINYKVERGVLMGIANDRAWTHITKGYNIPNRDRCGENHHNSKLTEADVHKICKLLADPKVTYEDILEQFDGRFSIHAIIDVAHRRTWTHISKQYDFPKRTLKGLQSGSKHANAKLTDEDVHKICRLLQDTDMKYQDIADVVGGKVSLHTVFRIRKGKLWPHISKDYDFSRRD